MQLGKIIPHSRVAHDFFSPRRSEDGFFLPRRGHKIHFMIPSQKIHSSVKLYKIRNNVIIQKFILEKVLQILMDTFFDKMLIFCYDFMKTLLKMKNSIFRTKFAKYGKNIIMQNWLLKYVLLIYIHTVFDNILFFLFDI